MDPRKLTYESNAQVKKGCPIIGSASASLSYIVLRKNRQRLIDGNVHNREANVVSKLKYQKKFEASFERYENFIV